VRLHLPWVSRFCSMYWAPNPALDSDVPRAWADARAMGRRLAKSLGLIARAMPTFTLIINIVQ